LPTSAAALHHAPMIRLSLCAFVALVPLVACSAAAPAEGVSTSESLVSSTRTFLVPVDARARVACRDEVNAYYCSDEAAHAAIGACLAKIGVSDGSDACATDDPQCVRTETYDEPCTGTSNPVYPDANSCESPRPNNCSFYSACVDRETPCGESGYALGYGEKYCTAFKNLDGLTAKGNAWISSVMHCLQEELVQYSQPTSTGACSEILDAAFASHPVCYTQPDNSICFLPPSDVMKVLGTIGGSELFTARSQKQILATIGTCIGQIGHWLLPFGTSARVHADPIVAPSAAPMSQSELVEQDRFWRSLEEKYKAAPIVEGSLQSAH
jgi:hypothetical protein